MRRVKGNRHYSAAANLDRVNEDGVSGDGRYYSIGLEARLTPALSLRASVSDGQSLQGGPVWSETTYLLSVGGRLF
jgi:hypothetical protein